MADCQKSVANKSAMQVQNLKSTLNEWKYVVALLDQGLNAADPIKSASARAGVYTTLYIILLVTNPSLLTLTSVILALTTIADIFIGKINDKFFASKEFTEEMDNRFAGFCEGIVTKVVKVKACVGCALKMKAESPYRFLTYSLPFFAFTAYLGKKMSIPTIAWMWLMVECALMVPQVQQQYAMVTDKVDSVLRKKAQKTE